MVLLAGVTLVSAVIAGGAALMEPGPSVSKSRPVYAANVTTRSPAAAPARLVDEVSVRMVGAPFVPNTNPRQR